MEMDKDKRRKAPKDEIEVAYYTKELGRPLQRKMLQRRFNDFSESSNISAVTHGEDARQEADSAPPQEDRAG